jgi:hypothetical protein
MAKRTPPKKRAAKKTARKAAKKAAPKKSLRTRRWRVVCKTDGLIGTYQSLAAAQRARDSHLPATHQVKIIGEQ